MRKFTIRISLFVVAIVMILSVGSNWKTVSVFANSKKDENQKVPVKIWIRASGPDPGILAIIDKFNREQDKIKVSYEFYGENYTTVVQMALAANDQPEILEASAGITVQTLAKQGKIVPIGDVVNAEVREKLHPDTLKPVEFYYKSKLYAVPVRISAYRLLYNKDLFRAAGLDPKRPPKTMEEMREMAQKITEAGKGNFYGFGLPLGVAQIWERVIDPVNVAMGVGDRYGYNHKTGKFDFKSNIPLFNAYVDMMKDGSLFPGYLTLGIDPLRANFAQGRVGMYIDGTWMAGSYAVQMDTKCDWDCAPLPVLKGATAGKYWAEGGVNWVVTKSKNMAAAKKFYKFWLENQQLANEYMPVPRTDLTANKLDKLPINRYKLKGLQYSFETADLQISVFEPHKFISLQGDDRNKVLTNIFAKAASGQNIEAELNTACADLNTRYTQGLKKAIDDGAINPKDLKRTK